MQGRRAPHDVDERCTSTTAQARTLVGTARAGTVLGLWRPQGRAGAPGGIPGFEKLKFSILWPVRVKGASRERGSGSATEKKGCGERSEQACQVPFAQCSEDAAPRGAGAVPCEATLTHLRARPRRCGSRRAPRSLESSKTRVRHAHRSTARRALAPLVPASHTCGAPMHATDGGRRHARAADDAGNARC